MAAHTTEDENHLETDLNQELTKESTYIDISDQKEENNTVKEFQKDPILDQKLISNIKTTSEEPNQSTGVLRSTWSKVQSKKGYVPSMTGNTYKKVMTQLDKQGTLHLDAHLLFNLAVEEQPPVMSEIMTQLSLKVGLKTWGDKGKEDMKSEMRQLHLRENFEP